MRRRLAWLCTLVMATAARSAGGGPALPAVSPPLPTSGPEYEAIIKAAVILGSIGALSQRCTAKGGFAAADAATIARWSTVNRADAVRTRVRVMRANRTNADMIDRAVGVIAGVADKPGVDACAAAVRLIGSTEAQFASTLPQLAMQAAPAVGSPRPDGSTTAARARVSTTADPTAIIGRIDSIAFDSRPSMGIGGFITTQIYPVILFRDGSVLTDVVGLSDPRGLAAHRAAAPQAWTRWKRSGAKIELLKNGAWKPLYFEKTYTRLPANFRLDGLFRRLSGGGNIAVGGSQSISIVDEYRFWPDGSVVRGGSAGATAAAGSTSVVTRSVAPRSRGRYQIDGLTIVMTYDDGSSERRILVADPADPKGAIWLDGNGYVERRR